MYSRALVLENLFLKLEKKENVLNHDVKNTMCIDISKFRFQKYFADSENWADLGLSMVFLLHIIVLVPLDECLELASMCKVMQVFRYHSNPQFTNHSITISALLRIMLPHPRQENNMGQGQD